MSKICGAPVPREPLPPLPKAADFLSSTNTTPILMSPEATQSYGASTGNSGNPTQEAKIDLKAVVKEIKLEEKTDQELRHQQQLKMIKARIEE